LIVSKLVFEKENGAEVPRKRYANHILFE